MNQTDSPSPSLSSSLDFVLLILRIACAVPMLYHGSAILLGLFGGPGPINFAAYLHMPAAVGYLVGLAQVAGGLAILLGAFHRVGAVSIIVVMLGAISLVHWPHGFDIGKNGFEYALTQLLLAFSLLIAGPGAYSLRGILPASLHKL